MRKWNVWALCLVVLSGCSTELKERAVDVPSLPRGLQVSSKSSGEMTETRVLELRPSGESPSLSLPRIESPQIHFPEYTLPERYAPEPAPSYRLPEKQIESPHWPVEPRWRTPEWNFRPDFQVSEWAQIELDWTYPFEPPNLKSELALAPGAKLRPRSPYCMPGHLSQNFVVTSLRDGLPLHPGVW